MSEPTQYHHRPTHFPCADSVTEPRQRLRAHIYPNQSWAHREGSHRPQVGKQRVGVGPLKGPFNINSFDGAIPGSSVLPGGAGLVFGGANEPFPDFGLETVQAGVAFLEAPLSSACNY